MQKNGRRHPRIPMSVDVRIAHPAIGEKVVKTRNISESGLFILVEPTEMPEVGEVVCGQVLGVENPPLVDMKIVRTENEGLGLRFMEDIEKSGDL